MAWTGGSFKVVRSGQIPDYRHVMKIELTAFNERSDVGMREKRGLKECLYSFQPGEL